VGVARQSRKPQGGAAKPPRANLQGTRQDRPALSIREFLADLWNYEHREDAEQHLESVLSWCSRARMQPFVKLGTTLREVQLISGPNLD